MNEDINDMIERVFGEHLRKREATDAVRNEKIKQVSKEMLEQIKSEVVGFDSVQNPTARQKYEQSCRLAMLLSYENVSIFDVRLRTVVNTDARDENNPRTERDGIVELWCDTTVLLFDDEAKLFGKLNSLADQIEIQYSKEAFSGGDIIIATFDIYNISDK